MTKEEWKARYAAQCMKQAGLTQDQANKLAETNFCEHDDEFSELRNYDPEQCAKNDMDYKKW